MCIVIWLPLMAVAVMIGAFVEWLLDSEKRENRKMKRLYRRMMKRDMRSERWGF